MAKNETQSDLHKKYIELKRKIASAQHMIEFEKRQYWDIWCTDDERTFNKIKAYTIRELKLDLKVLHRECKILKMKIVQANQAYQRQRLFDRMNSICDEILEMLDAKKEDYSV